MGRTGRPVLAPAFGLASRPKLQTTIFLFGADRASQAADNWVHPRRVAWHRIYARCGEGRRAHLPRAKRLRLHLRLVEGYSVRLRSARGTERTLYRHDFEAWHRCRLHHTWHLRLGCRDGLVRREPGALDGGYGGLTVGASVGVGASANALVGGFKNSIELQPIGVEGDKRLDVAASIGAISLKYNKS